VKHYDVIVVGGGHAGAEACHAAARLGARTLLVSGNLRSVGALSCNPAVGGVGKGHLVREIDALGGMMGRITDRATVQYRVLNRGKGPAVWSPRAQVDRQGYPQQMWKILQSIDGLVITEGIVVQILEEGGRVGGVALSTESGEEEQIRAEAVVLCCGTFLEGMIHIGSKIENGGRWKEAPVGGLTRSVTALGIESKRFKTGTPPRIKEANINFESMVRQDGEEPRGGFSFFESREPIRQLPCWITATSEKTHNIINDSIDEAPLFTGQIKARGPRYCPSIEDKVVRFPDRSSHLVFVEPEGRTSSEFYLNGLSTSMPKEAQTAIVRSVKGLENAEIVRLGYAIEYDYFPPEALKPTLETGAVAGLYMAGQINGTTGYEEAGAQGLVAGINAAHQVLGREPFVLPRTESVIGVLIDDLVTKGVTEPYRMFTSRIEYRLILRADNADLRLSCKGREIGLLAAEDFRRVEQKQHYMNELVHFLEDKNIEPAQVNEYLEKIGSTGIDEPARLSHLLKRPGVGLEGLVSRSGFSGELPPEEVTRQVELEVKYAGYFRRERNEIEKIGKQERVLIPEDFPYESVGNISTEAREKLAAAKPRSLGQASRISGVSISDLAALVLELGKRNVSRETSGEAGSVDRPDG
jgi:tRNA uridine 5-carboxymethylaminomethyl modification enzyme